MHGRLKGCIFVVFLFVYFRHQDPIRPSHSLKGTGKLPCFKIATINQDILKDATSNFMDDFSLFFKRSHIISHQPNLLWAHSFSLCYFILFFSHRQCVSPYSGGLFGDLSPINVRLSLVFLMCFNDSQHKASAFPCIPFLLHVKNISSTNSGIN